MSYATYFIIRQVLMGILLFMGTHMLLIKLPSCLNCKFYVRSKRIMGAAFMIVPISCFLYNPENRLDLAQYVSSAINLTAYFSTFLWMCMAFLVLLGKKISKPTIWISIIVGTFYSLPLWYCIRFCKPEVIELALTAGYSFFIIMILLFVISMLINHNRAVRNLENYYSDDMKICITWVSKSIYMLIGLVLICIISPLLFSFPRWLRLLCMLYGVGCYFYIYYGYRMMLFNLTEFFITHNLNPGNILDAECSDLSDGALGSDVKLCIQKRLEAWLEQKSYLKPGLTITEVATELNTNRTYLSRYINSVYGYSFRVWVTRLRIEESKSLLTKNLDLPINVIANAMGFASQESFTHIFRRVEGTSPTLWREENSTQTQK